MRAPVCRLRFAAPLALCGLSVVWVSISGAAEPEIELLWTSGAPGANGTEEKDKPKLMIYPAAADKINGSAVVVCPGGGYGNLAMDHEGRQIVAAYVSAHQNVNASTPDWGAERCE